MMVCEKIGCAHPRFLESRHGMTWDDLVDWYGYLLWMNSDPEDESTEKVEYLQQVRKDWNM